VKTARRGVSPSRGLSSLFVTLLLFVSSFVSLQAVSATMAAASQPDMIQSGVIPISAPHVSSLSYSGSSLYVGETNSFDQINHAISAPSITNWPTLGSRNILVASSSDGRFEYVANTDGSISQLSTENSMQAF